MNFPSIREDKRKETKFGKIGPFSALSVKIGPFLVMRPKNQLVGNIGNDHGPN
jgi:hypothetical protein